MRENTKRILGMLYFKQFWVWLQCKSHSKQLHFCCKNSIEVKLFYRDFLLIHYLVFYYTLCKLFMLCRYQRKSIPRRTPFHRNKDILTKFFNSYSSMHVSTCSTSRWYLTKENIPKTYEWLHCYFRKSLQFIHFNIMMFYSL